MMSHGSPERNRFCVVRLYAILPVEVVTCI